MCPLIRAAGGIPVNRPEPSQLTAAFLQNVQNFTAQSRRADRIYQQFDCPPLMRLCGEGFGETPAYSAAPEYVLLHRDSRLGGLDRVQHGWIKLVAIVVDCDAISSDQRHAGHTSQSCSKIRGCRVDGGLQCKDGRVDTG